MLDGELLRERTAPGEAEHVDPVVAQLVEHPPEHPGQLRETVGQRADRGAADAGGVEPDDVDAGIQGINQWLQQFEAGSDAAAHDQRCSGAVAGSNVYPQPLVADHHLPVAGFPVIGPAPRTVRLGPVDPLPPPGLRRRDEDPGRAVGQLPHRCSTGTVPAINNVTNAGPGVCR